MHTSHTNQRIDFLKKVCPTVAFAFFGLSFLEACSKEETADTTPPTTSNPDKGYTLSNGVYTIDLTNTNFSSLNTVGGWMNGYSIGLNMLFLRTSSDHIQAYTNSCPHQGARNQWELVGSNFRCNNHNNSFSSDCEGANALPCYTSSIQGTTLSVVL